MHRDTPSCSTQQPGLPPPLLSVRAQQARPLPKHTPHEGHARASFRNACRQRTNDSDAIARGVLYTSRTLDTSPTSAPRCTLASYWPVWRGLRFPCIEACTIDSHCSQEHRCVRVEQINDRSASRAPERAAHGCTARVRAPGVQILTSSSSSATASTGKVRCDARAPSEPTHTRARCCSLRQPG